MSIKILGGKARGYPLATPKGDTTRPTSVLIKRKLFDWRQNLEGYTFIDLFAGSGGVGYEALSRGADRVLLNDSVKGAYLTLKQNQENLLKSFDFEKNSIVLSNLDAKMWLNKEFSYQISNDQDCILFLDPPYEKHDLYFDVLAQLTQHGYSGEVWLETDRLKGPKQESIIGAFHSIIKIVEQGDHFVVVGKLV
jgi:16S rRNA (guanine966-N2)-methyltransferase